MSPLRLASLFTIGNFPALYLAVSLVIILATTYLWLYLYLHRERKSGMVEFPSWVSRNYINQQIAGLLLSPFYVYLIIPVALEAGIVPFKCSTRVLMAQYRITSYFSASFNICNDSMFTAVKIMGVAAALLSLIHGSMVVLFFSENQARKGNALNPCSSVYLFLVFTQKILIITACLLIDDTKTAIIALYGFLLALALSRAFIWATRPVFTDFTTNHFELFCLLAFGLWVLKNGANLILDPLWNSNQTADFFLEPLVFLAIMLVSYKLASKIESYLITKEDVLKRGDLGVSRLLRIYHFLKKHDDGDGRANKTIACSLRDSYFSILIMHYVDCNDIRCICNSVKSGKKVYDTVTEQDIDFGNSTNQKSYYTTFLFTRELLLSSMYAKCAQGRCQERSLLELISFHIFELKNPIRASKLLLALRNFKLDFQSSLDLMCITTCLENYFAVDINKKHNCADYVNVNHILILNKMQNDIKDSLVQIYGSYDSLIGYLVRLLGEDSH